MSPSARRPPAQFAVRLGPREDRLPQAFANGIPLDSRHGNCRDGRETPKRSAASMNVRSSARTRRTGSWRT